MFDESNGITKKMREKEQAQDYRFISDPDLPIIKIEDKKVEKISKELPETPHEKLQKLIKKHKIKKKSAEILTKKLEIIKFFEKIIDNVHPKLAVRWVTEELLSVLNYNKKELDEVEIKVEHFIELLQLLEKKIITELKAKDILRSFIPKSFSPKTKIKKHTTISGKTEIEKICKEVIKNNPQAVEDYKHGKQEALNFLIGQIMKQTNKRADYKTAKDVLEKKLK